MGTSVKDPRALDEQIAQWLRLNWSRNEALIAKDLVAWLTKRGDLLTEESVRQRAARIAEGECSTAAGWCLTHNEPDSMEHHFTANPGAFND